MQEVKPAQRVPVNLLMARPRVTVSCRDLPTAEKEAIRRLHTFNLVTLEIVRPVAAKVRSRA